MGVPVTGFDRLQFRAHRVSPLGTGSYPLVQLEVGKVNPAAGVVVCGQRVVTTFARV
jgi:hypothetical protein